MTFQNNTNLIIQVSREFFSLERFPHTFFQFYYILVRCVGSTSQNLLFVTRQNTFFYFIPRYSLFKHLKVIIIIIELNNRTERFAFHAHLKEM